MVKSVKSSKKKIRSLGSKSFLPGHTRPEPQIMPRSKSSPVTAIRGVDEVWGARHGEVAGKCWRSRVTLADRGWKMSFHSKMGDSQGPTVNLPDGRIAKNPMET